MSHDSGTAQGGRPQEMPVNISSLPRGDRLVPYMS